VVPTASTQSSTQADVRLGGGVAPTLSTDDPFTDVEDAMARLVHASYPPDAKARGPASDRADACISQSFAAVTLGTADLRQPIVRERRSLGRRGTLACVALAVCLGAFAIWSWRSYASWAPAERRQIETMADLAALRQTVEQLAASQERLTREIARLQGEKPDKRMLRRVSAPPAPPVAAPPRKPAAVLALMPPANPPPLRPTTPGPQH
jgi:type VI protein secretion system component VasK